MGCNCGKPASPTGSKPKPTSTPSGGLASKTQSFVLQNAEGRTAKFTGSLLEAQAAAVRSGATIRPS
jgi:hypothetical protein